MNEPAQRRQCKATNRQGKRCGRYPIRGGFVCVMHGGGSPGAKRKAADRIRDVLADAIDPDRALREMARLAYSNVRELFDDSGNILPVKKWPADLAAAVASVEIIKRNVDSGDGKIDDVLKVKVWDKPKSLEMIGKHLKLFTETLEVSGEVNIIERLIAGRKRVADARRS